MKPIKANCCGGKYGKSLDVKITNNCNGKCKFCIEKNGYSPSLITFPKTERETIEYNPVNILLLGGEPSLSPVLEKYIYSI